ncbi:hypothetical protein V8G54_007783 [Vigna mungo]|uniref:Uncharacterized protein n=1 Tax=Vigna mungo TaxID=3915 RepID=A0AAQ3S997_VIGMU
MWFGPWRRGERGGARGRIIGSQRSSTSIAWEHREDFDERFILEADDDVGGFRIRGVEGGGDEEGVVGVREEMERDAMLGEEGEVGVGGVVEEGSGKDAHDVDRGVGVDVDVEEVGGVVVEEKVEEFEGVGGKGGEGVGIGAIEEVDVIEFIGGRDWKKRIGRERKREKVNTNGVENIEFGAILN